VLRIRDVYTGSGSEHFSLPKYCNAFYDFKEQVLIVLKDIGTNEERILKKMKDNLTKKVPDPGSAIRDPEKESPWIRIQGVKTIRPPIQGGDPDPQHFSPCGSGSGILEYT
jgi:hypothetical protein